MKFLSRQLRSTALHASGSVADMRDGHVVLDVLRKNGLPSADLSRVEVDTLDHRIVVARFVDVGAGEAVSHDEVPQFRPLEEAKALAFRQRQDWEA